MVVKKKSTSKISKSAKASKSKTRKATKTAKATPRKATKKLLSSFPIVGIGASAGGLEAVTQLISNLPDDTNLAYVLVQHLDPTHESFSAEILARKTKMRVEEIKDNTKVRPNHFYIIPPNHLLVIEKGVLMLKPRPEKRSPQMSVDYFFQSLAQDQKQKAIGIILTGTGTDGTHGLEAIKSKDGLVIVQDPVTAKFDGMPRSAVSTGIVDLVLTPELIAKELVRLAHHPIVTDSEKIEPSELKMVDISDGEYMDKIFALLRSQSHVDFTNYKTTTIKRRIARRMIIKSPGRLLQLCERQPTGSSRSLC